MESNGVVLIAVVLGDGGRVALAVPACPELLQRVLHSDHRTHRIKCWKAQHHDNQTKLQQTELTREMSRKIRFQTRKNRTVSTQKDGQHHLGECLGSLVDEKSDRQADIQDDKACSLALRFCHLPTNCGCEFYKNKGEKYKWAMLTTKYGVYLSVLSDKGEETSGHIKEQEISLSNGGIFGIVTNL